MNINFIFNEESFVVDEGSSDMNAAMTADFLKNKYHALYEAEPSDDMREKLLRAVPFALGTENITGGWIDNQFKRLAAVFASEISSYDGQVSMYFTEKSQKLHVPERIFFHALRRQRLYLR